MAGWDDILKELGDTPSPSDLVRRKYIKQLSQYTKRTQDREPPETMRLPELRPLERSIT